MSGFAASLLSPPPLLIGAMTPPHSFFKMVGLADNRVEDGIRLDDVSLHEFTMVENGTILASRDATSGDSPSVAAVCKKTRRGALLHGVL